MWVEEMKKLLTNCQPACEWFIEFLSGPNGEHYLKLVVIHVLHLLLRLFICLVCC